MDDPNEPLFPPVAAASTAAAPSTAPTAEKLSLDGIVTTKTGAIYFGHIEESQGRVEITVPTAGGKVRTVRHLNLSQVASTKAIPRGDILRLAKIGPHVLAKTDVERVVPNSTKPAAIEPPATPEKES